MTEEKINVGRDEVILMTGGAGFLGKHIIRELQTRTTGIQEIRIFDMVNYEQKFVFDPVIPVKMFRGDVSVKGQLEAPFQGVTCVIHSAAVISVGHYQDKAKLERINIRGTRNIVEMCLENRITKLVLTSSVDAVIWSGGRGPYPESILWNVGEGELLGGFYAYSKAQAECIVGSVNNHQYPNGTKLKTIILRQNPLFGELDTTNVPPVLKAAKSNGGYFLKPWIRHETWFQHTYAGNAAWAHILALAKLNDPTSKEPDNPVYFIPDGNEPKSFYRFMEPFLMLKGYSVANTWIPYEVILYFLTALCFLIKWLFPKPLKQALDRNGTLPTAETYQMIHSQMGFSASKAQMYLGYKPIYSTQESFNRAAKFYEK